MIRYISHVHKFSLFLLLTGLCFLLAACGGEPPLSGSENSLYTQSSQTFSATEPTYPTMPSDLDAVTDDAVSVPDGEERESIPSVQEGVPDAPAAFPEADASQEASRPAATSKPESVTSQTQTVSSSRLTTTVTTTATSASRTTAATTATRPSGNTTQQTRPTFTTKPTVGTTTTTTTPPASNSSFEKRVFELVNEERAKAGVKPLKWKETLAEGAKIRAVEIQTSFSHTRPNGETCFTVAPGVRGENIAKGQSTPEEVMKGWMNSAGHRSNILSPDFQYIAVAFNQRHWVQLFG